MINFKWVILTMDVKPKEGSLENVVVKVSFRRVGIDGTYSAQVCDGMLCESPSETDFTAYADLTETQVCSWLDAWVGLTKIDSIITTNIENQKNPPIINLPLPF